jgi:N6-adenosine-specific RNA methylase IME4
MSEIALVRYDAACKALADATAVDEAKKIRDVAEAMRAYARQAKNKQLEADAWEIRIRAERRIGELIAAQREAEQLNRGGRPSEKPGTKTHPVSKAPTLEEVLGPEHKRIADRSRKYASVPQSEFDSIVADGRERVVSAQRAESERVTTNLIRAGEREQKKDARPSRELPSGQYRLIYADPPWRYEHSETENRAIENQYPTMELDEIRALRVPAADDSVLYLWATSPKLAEAMTVIEAWGFSYRTCAVWDKEKIGMGYYFRQQHELLLVAAKGALPVPEPSARVSSVIRVKRPGIHSRKPVQVIELLESMYPAFTKVDRIELFTREPRVGWSAWGNEPEAATA